MTKQLGRKKPKRKPPPSEPEDLDLDFLSAVLDENRFEQSVDHWFKIAWRDGWNAVYLASELGSIPYDDASAFLREALQLRSAKQETYWRCGELIHELDLNHKNAPYRYAALRCLQVLSSNSHGGGEVYNVILRRAFDRSVLFDQYEMLGQKILEARCHDAIGVWPQMNNDASDRYRRAFTIAWKRGLFHAAYAIKRK